MPKISELKNELILISQVHVKFRLYTVFPTIWYDYTYSIHFPFLYMFVNKVIFKGKFSAHWPILIHFHFFLLSKVNPVQFLRLFFYLFQWKKRRFSDSARHGCLKISYKVTSWNNWRTSYEEITFIHLFLKKSTLEVEEIMGS